MTYPHLIKQVVKSRSPVHHKGVDLALPTTVNPEKSVFAAVAMSHYDWEKEKWSDRDLVNHFQDIDFCSKLKLSTLTCETCGLRVKIDVAVPEVEYCSCNSPKLQSQSTCQDWTPFVERKDILVWRKEHAKKKGLYHYKLYGVFDDITVWEFLAVQLDLTKFRLGWDSSTAVCKQVDAQNKDCHDVLNRDEIHTTTSDVDSSNNFDTDTFGKDSSEAMVYYWEVHWPTFFSNRDYCCLRQHLTDPTGRMVISSRTTRHQRCPVTKKNWRVQDYQSVMAVRPTVHPDKPGVEFALTAFEDPGVALPESIISFVAVRAMPEFMTNLRAACHLLRGAVKNSDLPKPEFFRKAAALTNEGLFECHNNEDENDLEACISKGDAAYESAWIDKLLKDSDDSQSETDDHLDRRKSSAADEALSIRKDPAVAFPESLVVSSPQLLSSHDCLQKTSSDQDCIDQSLDYIDIIEIESNHVQEETLNMFKANNSGKSRCQAPKKDDGEAPCTVVNISMDQTTLNTVAVNEDMPKVTVEVNKNLVTDRNPLKSSMRESLLLEDEDTKILRESSQEDLVEKFVNKKNNLEGYFINEMELILFEEKEISRQSTILEKLIRDYENDGISNQVLLEQWMQLISKKNLMFHRRLLLELLQDEDDLEKKSIMIQDQLRAGVKDELSEKLLLEELRRIVDLRDQLENAKDKEEVMLQEEINFGIEIKNENFRERKVQKCIVQ